MPKSRASREPGPRSSTWPLRTLLAHLTPASRQALEARYGPDVEEALEARYASPEVLHASLKRLPSPARALLEALARAGGALALWHSPNREADGVEALAFSPRGTLRPEVWTPLLEEGWVFWATVHRFQTGRHLLQTPPLPGAPLVALLPAEAVQALAALTPPPPAELREVWEGAPLLTLNWLALTWEELRRRPLKRTREGRPNLRQLQRLLPLIPLSLLPPVLLPSGTPREQGLVLLQEGIALLTQVNLVAPGEDGLFRVREGEGEGFWSRPAAEQAEGFRRALEDAGDFPGSSRWRPSLRELWPLLPEVPQPWETWLETLALRYRNPWRLGVDPTPTRTLRDLPVRLRRLRARGAWWTLPKVREGILPLLRWLHGLGWLELLQDGGETLYLVRRSRPPDPGPERLLVQPNFQILVLEPRPSTLLWLERFCQRRRLERVAEYILERSTFLAGLREGISLTRIREEIQRRESPPPPPSVWRTLEGWAREHRRIRLLRRGFLLQTRTPRELQALLDDPELAPYLRTLGPTLAWASDGRRVRRLLQARGVVLLRPGEGPPPRWREDGRLDWGSAAPDLAALTSLYPYLREVDGTWALNWKALRALRGAPEQVQALLQEMERIQRAPLPPALWQRILAETGFYGAARTLPGRVLILERKEARDLLLKDPRTRGWLRPVPAYALWVEDPARWSELKAILAEKGIPLRRRRRSKRAGDDAGGGSG